MKITQEKTFNPVIITLESAEEVSTLFDFVEGSYKHFPCGDKRRQLGVKISNSLGLIQ